MTRMRVLEKALIEGLALTFDDVTLRTGPSKVMPDDVSLESQFSRNVGLKIPIVSAAMDTVTEFRLAIELAKLGGIGVIHRSLSAIEQANHVARVKNHLNGLIAKPVCVYEDESIEAIEEMRRTKGYTFSSFPVLTHGERLIGILTGNDFEFCEDRSRFARDVMTSDPSTASEGTTIGEAYRLMRDNKKKVLPLVNSNGEVRGMYVFSDVRRIETGDAQTHNVDSRGQLRVAAAIGTGEDALGRLEKLSRENVDVVVIDTAHGDSFPVFETLKQIKAQYEGLDVVVGNISVGDSVKRLVEAGADGIKVGQGPGSICTTRVVAGIGRPQISAIFDCARAADEFGIPICGDGGLRDSGDITKAIAAGAHSVMMGSMLAGTEETPGEIVFVQGRRWKVYRGMGSLGAMMDSKGSRERYLQGNRDLLELVPEGIDARVPYRGSLSEVLTQYLGGLRQGMGYVGAADIEELRANGDFDRITESGKTESHPHDVEMTQEPPNYQRRT